MEKIFFKLIRANWKHYDRIYSVGEHRYKGPMSRESFKDGLYYCHINDLPRWTQLHDDMKYVCPVELYADSIIIKQRYKYKTDHFKLLDPIPLEEFLKAHYSGLYLVECHPENVKYVSEETIVNDLRTHLFYNKQISTQVYGDKSAESDLPAFRILRNIIREEIHTTAVKKDGVVIQFIKRPSLNVQIEAIRQNVHSFKFLAQNGTYDTWIEGVQKDGMALGLIPEKYRTEKLCLVAVSMNGLALQYVVNQTYDMCMIAVKENGYALQFVKRKHPEMCLAAWRQNNNIKNYIPPDIYKQLEPQLVLPNGRRLREIIIN